MTPATRLHLRFWIPVMIALVLSGIRPYDRIIWLAEVLPVLIALPILAATARKFPLTLLCHELMALFSMILIIGGAYTYARVPAGFWLQETLELSRNPWDRIGHFFQGVTPAILGRELLLRTSPLKRGKWLFTLVTLSCLGISALYELIEWGSAVWAGEGSTDFLGSQGDVWDAQWDMFLALGAAYVAAHRPSDILNLVTVAFSLAASAFVPALVLGIFWRKATRAGAVAGMLAGLVVAAGYTLIHASALQQWLPTTQPIPLLWGIQPISSAVFGVPAGIVILVAVSLLTQPATKNQSVRT